MQNFLSIADHTPEELLGLLELAESLKKEYQTRGRNPALLQGKVLAMVFQKPSLRTRVSFDMAMRHLGGDALYLSPFEIGLGERESIADVARVLSGYVHAIMARVFAHDHVVELARWADVPVINGLSDFNHPCQALADAFTIYERFGQLKGVRVAYVGDGNNVAVSLMQVCAKLGAPFSIATPAGYELAEDALEVGKRIAAENGTEVRVLRDPVEAVTNAQVIYTDTWTSMGQEEEARIREQVFPPYQVNADLVRHADSEVIVMHCLPAHRGQEITDEVADGPHSVLFPQAHNRLHAQKAVLVRVLETARPAGVEA